MMTWEPAPSEGKPSTLGKAGKWTMKEGGWGIFKPNREESAYLKKKTKGEVAKKEFWKVSLEALEKGIKS